MFSFTNVAYELYHKLLWLIFMNIKWSHRSHQHTWQLRGHWRLWWATCVSDSAGVAAGVVVYSNEFNIYSVAVPALLRLLVVLVLVSALYSYLRLIVLTFYLASLRFDAVIVIFVPLKVATLLRLFISIENQSIFSLPLNVK